MKTATLNCTRLLICSALLGLPASVLGPRLRSYSRCRRILSRHFDFKTPPS